MSARRSRLSLGLCGVLLAGVAACVAGCSIDTAPSGVGWTHNNDGGPGEGGAAHPDAGHDAATPKDAGHKDAGMVKPPKDAGGSDAAKPRDDSGIVDAGADTGVDAGPPPVAPSRLVFPLAGGQIGYSPNYVLRSSVGAMRPTGSPTVSTGAAASQHYKLVARLAWPTP
jgi:hypothetical protein